ncbi:MAG: hypothetical protein QNJ38_14435 [Prochloraceae cyanobacterium]|nr:hypothetical protein [Prochloraceae cyanobacterium]
MQSIQLKTHVGEDGLLTVQMPPEIKDMELDVMVVFQPSSNEEQLRYNAWGKPITRKSIEQTIAGMKQLRKQVAMDKDSLRSMKEEGRRF